MWGLALEGWLTLVTREDDMGILQQVGTEDVGKRVVFLVEREDGAIWGACRCKLGAVCAGQGMRGKHTSVRGLGALLLAIGEQKELEPIQLISLLLDASMPPVC
jgi:hypothetical protein